MLTHGISHTSVYSSVWGVVDCVNRNTNLHFDFPGNTEQHAISEGFKLMSGARFDNVVGCIDGMLI